MRVTSIAAVIIAVSGLGLATQFKVYRNVASVNAAVPDSFVGNNGLAIAAAMSSGSPFGPLRDDICEDGMRDSLTSSGIEGKQMFSAAPNAACGKSRTRDRAVTDE
jgi:hypothetical protein